MNDHRPPFDEFDLRHALSGEATLVRPVADPERLRAGMVRADRLRTVRAAATAGVMAIVVALGVLNLQGVEERSLVDTVDQPDVLPPEPTVPAIDDAASEEAESAPEPTADEPQLVTVATSVAPSTTLAPGSPDHLTPPPTTAAPAETVATTAPPTTTTVPAAVVSTTVPPSTTAAPTTTAPPTTTAAPTTTTTPALFTASARYGSCELDPPYDEYSGTAAPGATVTITSPYSTPVEVTADGSGSWAMTVFFPSAPANETFSVTFSDGTSVKTLDFIHVVA